MNSERILQKLRGMDLLGEELTGSLLDVDDEDDAGDVLVAPSSPGKRVAVIGTGLFSTVRRRA